MGHPDTSVAARRRELMRCDGDVICETDFLGVLLARAELIESWASYVQDQRWVVRNGSADVGARGRMGSSPFTRSRCCHVQLGSPGVCAPHRRDFATTIGPGTTKGIAQRRWWSAPSYRCVYTDDSSETLSAK